MEGQDQVLGRREAACLSPAQSLHFNQGLRYKILLFRASQLWNLKHPHALSQLLLHKKKKRRKKEKEKSSTTKHQNPHREKRCFLFLLLFKNNNTEKLGEGREFLNRHFSRPLCMCVSVSRLQVEFCNTSGSFFPCVNNIYIYIFNQKLWRSNID